jgi:hypothetical protein
MHETTEGEWLMATTALQCTPKHAHSLCITKSEIKSNIPVQNQTRHNVHMSSASPNGNWKTPHQGVSIRKKKYYTYFWFRRYTNPQAFDDDISHLNSFNIVGQGSCRYSDGPEIESRWGQYFPHPSHRLWGPPQTSVKWVPGLFPG